MTHHIDAGQTLPDVAVVACGTWTAAFAIARKAGISITHLPAAGSEIAIPPDAPTRERVRKYLQSHNARPATAQADTKRMGVFDQTFNNTYI